MMPRDEDLYFSSEKARERVNKKLAAINSEMCFDDIREAFPKSENPGKAQYLHDLHKGRKEEMRRKMQRSHVELYSVHGNKYIDR